MLVVSACGGSVRAPVTATPSSTAEGAEPTADESGDESLLAPESLEHLQPALRAYRGGDYQRSAVLLQGVLDSGPTESTRLGALYFLAKAFFHLGYRWAALNVLLELAQEPGHPFRGRALIWLSHLARVLPDDRPVIAGLDVFEPTEVDDGAMHAPADVIRHLRYLMGRSAYRQGSFEDALAIFGQIPADSRWYLEARFVAALTHVRMRHVRPTLVALHDILRATGGLRPEGPERTRRLVELTWLNVGRLHYSAAGYHEGALERSLAAYGQLPPDSTHVPRALFEQAWVLLRLERYGDAEATLAALPDDLSRHPEAAYLRLVIGFCRSDASTGDAITAFVNAREHLPDQIEGWLEQQEEEEIFDALEALEAGGDFQGPQAVRTGLGVARESRRVRRHLGVIESIEREIELLDEAPDAFKAEEAWARALQDLVLTLSLERFNLGRVLRNHLRYQASEVRALVAQALEIQLRLAAEREQRTEDGESRAPEAGQP